MEMRPLQELPLAEILRCLRSSAPDTGKSYNKTLNVAGNLLHPDHLDGRHRHTEKGSRSHGRMPKISKDIVTIWDEFKNWASSLKALKDWDSGEAVSLKTKFCHFMRFGSNEDFISEKMEIG